MFAKNMVEDVALFKHLERAVESQHGFIRDSSGLWCRFYAMIVDGELKVTTRFGVSLCPAFLTTELLLQVEDKCRTLLTKAVTDCLERFDADGGTAPQYGGAVYAQVSAELPWYHSGSHSIGAGCSRLHVRNVLWDVDNNPHPNL